LNLDPDDESASGIFNHGKTRRASLKTKQQPNRNEKGGGRRDSKQGGTSGRSAGGGPPSDQNNLASGRQRRGSITMHSDEQYLMQGEGNNLQARQQDGSQFQQRSLLVRDSMNNSLGLGFAQSSNFQREGGGGNRDSGEELDNDELDPDGTKSKLQVRMRRNSLNNSTNQKDRRRSSTTGVVQKLKHGKEGRGGNYELPPVEVSKSKNKDEILKALNGRLGSNSSLSGDNSRPSSRAHSHCYDSGYQASSEQYDSKGDLLMTQSPANNRSDGSKPKTNNGFPRQKKNDIFFLTRFLGNRHGSAGRTNVQQMTPSERELLTPSPTHPSVQKSDLFAQRMSIMMSRMSFSYYKQVPIQYKQYNESIRSKATTTGGGGGGKRKKK